MAQHDYPAGLLGNVPTCFEFYRSGDPDAHRFVHNRVAIQTAAAISIARPVSSEATSKYRVCMQPSLMVIALIAAGYEPD